MTEPVTADNIEEYMAQAWAPTPEQGLSQSWWEHRKDFMQELGLAVLDKAFSSYGPAAAGEPGQHVHHPAGTRAYPGLFQ